MNSSPKHRDDEFEADVCLLLEGTYPYVPGGVSTWVHHLVSALKDVTFCGVVILPSIHQKWTRRYEAPPNLVKLDHVYIHDYQLSKTRRPIPRRRKAAKFLEEFHRALVAGRPEVIDRFVSLFYPANRRLISTEEMIHSKAAWDLLLKLYLPEENEGSFIDYFWTFRFTHMPVFQILDAPIPRARVYHTISTGYAGLMGVLAAKRNNRPLILTEHGIYTKERKIEISQAEWIYKGKADELRVQKEIGAFQRLWIKIFEGISRLTYHVSSDVITLYEGNRQIQIASGCPPDKIEIIPNGVLIESFAHLKADPLDFADSFRIGFVGRVVPIKDVKTFIRACKLISLRRPAVEFYIIGPTDEDKDYY
ncbi:MAG: GT4 family glycosyltransferase PelF, partial [Deltaproteobacteria bacterium]|nr:GT4 family glycosyltransferase PelF [Deltaproteobacteria bacterium]